MPVTTRKAKPKAKNYFVENEALAEALEQSEDDTMTFDKVFGHANNDSDPEPEFGKPKRKSRKTKVKSGGKKQKSALVPTLPEMSDDEDRRASDTSETDEYPLTVGFDDTKVSTSMPAITGSNALPQILQIHVDASHTNGKAIINLNLADLISSRAPKRSRASEIKTIPAARGTLDEDETLVEDDQPKHRSKRAKLQHNAKAQTLTTKSTKKGFTDLPYELRVDIYRRAFVKKQPLVFNSKEGFSRSSQFLRTCKLVYGEGREIMYGENAFHFSRSSKTRGTYFESDWKEIGFKDVRRFFTDINDNVSFMKYISFSLDDAAPSATPYLEEEQRRCVNDPILHHIFKLIGSRTVLNKFAIAFHIRRTIINSDYVFLKALSSIKCHHFSQARHWYSTRRMSYGIMDRLQKVMVSNKEVDEDVDLSRKKTVEPEMYLSSQYD